MTLAIPDNPEPHALPVEIPAVARALPDSSFLPVFASLIPQMIVPYADAPTVGVTSRKPLTAFRHRGVVRCRRRLASTS